MTTHSKRKSKEGKEQSYKAQNSFPASQCNEDCPQAKDYPQLKI